MLRRAAFSGLVLRGLGLLWLLLSLTAGAVEQPDARPQPTAPVMLDGTVLFHVRGALAYPATERAAAISGRIEAVAANRALPISALHTVEAGDRSIVQAGDQLLVMVIDADAEMENLTRKQVADLYSNRIAAGIDRYRSDRSPAALARDAMWALIATAALALAIVGLRRSFVRLSQMADRRFQSRIVQLKSETRQIVQAERVRGIILGMFGTAHVFTIVVLVLAYIEFVLSLWPWTHTFAHRVLGLVVDPLWNMGKAVLDAIPGLMFIVVLTVVTRYVLKVAGMFFSAIAEGGLRITNFEQEWAWPTYRIVRLVVIAFAAVIAYPYIPGSSSEAFKGVSVFLGVLFSLGSTSLIANLVAGYTLVYRRAFKIGDRVRIGEYFGDVTAMRLQGICLRSLKNEEIVIPNSVVLNSSSINYSTLSRQRGLILHTTVGIGYETPWRQVEAMLTEAARRTEGLLQHPAPFILQKSLGDFSVTYELNVYSDQPQQSEQLYTALHRNILDLFNEHHVQIMTPAYVGDPAAPKVVAKENWFLPPAAREEK